MVVIAAKINHAAKTAEETPKKAVKAVNDVEPIEEAGTPKKAVRSRKKTA